MTEQLDIEVIGENLRLPEGPVALKDGGALMRQVVFPGHSVTNICFGGDDLRTGYVTLSKSCKLVSVRWPVPGLRLNYQG